MLSRRFSLRTRTGQCQTHRALARLLLIWLLLLGSATRGDEAQPPATYVGSQVCADCHPTEWEQWRGSHHDRAMEEATGASVLGDFGDVELSVQGVTSRFFRRQGDYFVRTDGPDGELRDYRIRYTFGWWPLQQYLVAFPGGRLQSLGIAWDSRPAAEGGQRWFHLYPNERVDHTSRLHWTGRDQNWNYQCAECHSTNLRKNYDLATDSFRTTWSEIDVACEACHGPASRHLAQARAAKGQLEPNWDSTKGLLVDLADRDGGVWRIDEESGRPKRSVPRARQVQIEICARCHSRRGLLSEDYRHGRPLGDTHRLALLDTHLYHADGQIKDEVYVYGSFIQSRMYAQGVTCTDCHDPHRLTLEAPGNLVCARCHESGRYDSQTHHHHAPGSEGASCTGCHMPQRPFMVIDERADHSLRVPRPDLTLEIGTPNACQDCHADKTAEWAVEVVEAWYGEPATKGRHFGESLEAGRRRAPGAGDALLALAADASQPAIARATALDLLVRFPDPTYLLTVQRLLKATQPLVRAAAVEYLETADPQTRLEHGFPLLRDPVLAVRTAAASTLAPLARLPLPATKRRALEAALDEYRRSQLANAERPESHLNIGLIELALDKPRAAEQSYRTALRLDPRFGPVYVNLADLYRSLGRDPEGAEILRAGLETLPEDASLHHALGLLLIRNQEVRTAVESLARAARLAPDQARYAYVYALAVQHTGDLEQSLAILAAAHERHPSDRDILTALVAGHRERGDQRQALEYASRLKALK